jgi:hypothetical protein
MAPGNLPLNAETGAGDDASRAADAEAESG